MNTRRLIELQPGEEQPTYALDQVPEGFRLETDEEFRKRILATRHGGLLTRGDLLELCETVEELGWCHIRVKLRSGVDRLWFLDSVVPLFFKVEFI